MLARAELEKLGDDGWEIAFDDIEERIERAEREINEILTTEPYTYRALLEDEEKKTIINNILKDRRATFIIGMIMLIGGLWLFVQNVYVSSPWHPAGIHIGPFTFRSGVLVLPILGALVWMFFKPKS